MNLLSSSFGCHSAYLTLASQAQHRPDPLHRSLYSFHWICRVGLVAFGSWFFLAFIPRRACRFARFYDHLRTCTEFRIHKLWRKGKAHVQIFLYFFSFFSCLDSILLLCFSSDAKMQSKHRNSPDKAYKKMRENTVVGIVRTKSRWFYVRAVKKRKKSGGRKQEENNDSLNDCVNDTDNSSHLQTAFMTRRPIRSVPKNNTFFLS